MKKCPYCVEEIQSEAIKCRYCGERLDTKLTTDDPDEQLKNKKKLSGQGNSLPHEASKVESPPVSSPQQSAAIKPLKEKPKEEGESLYEAILGEKNRVYYLTKFKEFDQQALLLRKQKAGWNWAAFLGGGIWVIYRKMYGWFFAFLGIWTISVVVERAGFPVLGYFIFLLPWIAFAMFANSIYYGSVKKKIAVAQRSIRDRSQLIEVLRRKGGVHTWAIWLFGLLPVIGIAAAIIIPQIVNHNNGTEESTSSEPEAVVEMPAPAAPAPTSIETSGSPSSGYDLDKLKRLLFYSDLDKAVPGWTAINTDPNFLEWLDEWEYDNGNLFSRRELLKTAYDRSDAIEVAKYFKRFSSEYGPLRTLPPIK